MSSNANLSPTWQFVLRLSGFQVACLVAGIDPDTRQELSRDAQRVYDRMKSAHDIAVSWLLRHFDASSPSGFETFPPGSIRCEAIVRTWDPKDFGGDEMSEWLQDESATAFVGQVFSQASVHNWLNATGLTSAFQFSNFETMPCQSVEATTVEGMHGTEWPNHNTVELEALRLTARKFYGPNYDPRDRSTAPKAEQVAEYLVAKGMSKSKAQVAASILRPDDLPYGPRPKQ